MLEVVALSASYGPIKALRRVSLTVPTGAIVCLIGPNGAGKSTLLNAISKTLKPVEGKIILDGQDLTSLPAYEVARRGLIQVPEGRQILGPLTIEENLQLGYVAANGRSARIGEQLERVYALFPVLAERRRSLGGVLSGGQQQMLAIGRAMMAQPMLLLLDEPSLGLSPLMVSQVFASLQVLNKQGLSILLVEQNARRALAMSESAYVLEQGEIVKSGTGADLLNDPVVVDHYLGRATTSNPKAKGA